MPLGILPTLPILSSMSGSPVTAGNPSNTLVRNGSIFLSGVMMYPFQPVAPVFYVQPSRWVAALFHMRTELVETLLSFTLQDHNPETSKALSFSEMKPQFPLGSALYLIPQ